MTTGRKSVPSVWVIVGSWLATLCLNPTQYEMHSTEDLLVSAGTTSTSSSTTESTTESTTASTTESATSEEQGNI